MRKKGGIRESAGDRIFNAVNIALMCAVALMVIYPVYFIILASVSTPTEVNSGQLFLFPKEIYLSGYEKIFQYKEIWTGYANTILYTVVGTSINVAITIPAGYAFSRRNLRGRNVLMFFFAFTMFFGGGDDPHLYPGQESGAAGLHLGHGPAGACSVWNIIVTRTFMQTNIPEELFEAARIDGCNDFKFFFSIVVPLSKAIIAIMILFYAIGHWNNYFSGLIYLDSPEKFPLQMVLRKLLVQNQISSEMTSAGMASIAERAQIAEQMKYGCHHHRQPADDDSLPLCSKIFRKGNACGRYQG